MADWIPVTERLPERAAGKDTSDRVLCIDANGYQFVWVCFYERQHKDFDYGTPMVPTFENNVTHWMPLPPPPIPRGAGGRDAPGLKDCPHAAPHRYCQTCRESPCPIGLDAYSKFAAEGRSQAVHKDARSAGIDGVSGAAVEGQASKATDGQ